MAQITIDDVTSGVIGGTGTFDKLMAVVKLHLIEEYAAGRITADTYAQVYIQAMNQVLQTATTFTIQAQGSNANEALIAQKVITEKAQVQDKIEELKNVTDAEGIVQGSIGKQKEVYAKQVEAFRDKALQDFLNNHMNTWSVRRSTDPDTLASKENLLTDLDIGKSLKHVADHLGIVLPDPEPAPTP